MLATVANSFRIVSVTFLIFKELVGSDRKLESADKSCVIVQLKLSFTPHKVTQYTASLSEK